MKHPIIFSVFTSLVISFTTSAALAQSTDSEVWNYKVSAKKLDNSRNKLSPKTGGSSFSFSQKDIDNLPQGQSTPLNQLLLRAPGVVQNSYGQVHVRGDHSALQYRINGIMIPKGITSFGQSFDAHFIDSVDLLTGALPAQYGYKTAGVVEIKTKSGVFNSGGRSEVTICENQTRGVNQQIGGAKGNLNYFISASYLENNRGIDSATSRKPIHDDTRQDKAFGYFSYSLDNSSRLNLIVGNGTNRFQVPNSPGQKTSYTLSGQNAVDSSTLNQNQTESSRYAILAWQGVTDSEIDYQISYFTRYSELKYRSDYVGDLMLNGVASDIDRSSFINGAQGDFSYALDGKNTLRSGFFVSDEVTKRETQNAVFKATLLGTQTSSDPISISDGVKRNSQLYGVYLQDELKATSKLTFNFGGRLDASNSVSSESQFSPRLGSIYDLSGKTKLHAGYARYFTPPQSELLQNSTLSKFSGMTNDHGIDGGKVKSERTNYYDVGVSHQLSKGFTISLDAYLKQIRNVLDEGQFGNALIYTPFNFQRGKSRGVEFSADYSQGNFSSYFNFSAQQNKVTRVKSGRNLVDADEVTYLENHYSHADHDQTYSSSAGLAYLRNKTRYTFDGIYGSGLRHGFASTNRMKSYTQFNASVAHDFTLPLLNKTNFRLSAINLFDHSYQLNDGSGIGVAATKFGPRRTFFLIVSKSF